MPSGNPHDVGRRDRLQGARVAAGIVPARADQLGEPVAPAIWDGNMRWSYFILDTNPTISTAKQMGVVDNTGEAQDER